MEYIALPKQARDITGQRFGKLIALGPVGVASDRSMLWVCQCDCGKTATTSTAHLSSGHTKSCGCYIIEVNKAAATHGMSTSRLYHIRDSIIARCTNPKREAYIHYGGRGILICDEWRQSFQAFQEYVAALPDYDVPGMTLDRINNDGNYEPGNVRWATYATQARNYRRNRILTHNDRSMCLADWCAELNIKAATVLNRLGLGWTVERALTAPVRIDSRNRR